MRTALLAAGALLILAGCASGPSGTEERRYPDLTVRRSLDLVHDRCKQALGDSGFPIAGEDEAGLWSPWVKDRGFSWQLRLAFDGSEGIVRISATLGLKRIPDRGTGIHLGGALEDPSDDSIIEDVNLKAGARDREAIEAGAHQRASKRDERIRGLGDRVANFLAEFENQMALPSPGEVTPPVFP